MINNQSFTLVGNFTLNVGNSTLQELLASGHQYQVEQSELKIGHSQIPTGSVGATSIKNQKRISNIE